jgi:hypothetical protein
MDREETGRTIHPILEDVSAGLEEARTWKQWFRRGEYLRIIEGQGMEKAYLSKFVVSFSAAIHDSRRNLLSTGTILAQRLTQECPPCLIWLYPISVKVGGLLGKRILRSPGASSTKLLPKIKANSSIRSV